MGDFRRRRSGQHRVRSLAIVALACVAISSPAHSQSCQNEWLAGPSNEIPGADSYLEALVEWDRDGPGPERPQLIAGGTFARAGSVQANFIARWDGDQWNALGVGMSSQVEALATWDRDGDGPQSALLVAGGYFTTAGGMNANHIALWNGETWEALGSGTDGVVTSLSSWDPDGSGPQHAVLVAGGTFTIAGGLSSSNIAIWNGSSWQAVGSGTNGWVRSLASWDPDGLGPLSPLLVAGGSFTTAGGASANRIATWNGATWQPVGGGLNNGVECVTVWDPDGCGPQSVKLIAAGGFTSAGGVSANGIAAWSGASWQALGSGMSPPASRAVTTLDPDGSGPQADVLIATGDFASAGGMPANRIARWDGLSWQTLGSGLDTRAEALASWDPDGLGPQTALLGAGGYIGIAGGIGVASVALWNGSAWMALGAGVNKTAYALANWDSDGSGPRSARLVAGGEFMSAGGIGAAHVAVWDGLSWQSLGAGIQGPFAIVYALTSFDSDGNGPQLPLLIAGGSFDSAGGASAHNVAAWNGSSWQALGAGTDGSVRALTTWDPDGSGPQDRLLIAGGYFGMAGAVSETTIAAWNGAAWQALGAGIGSQVLALTAWDPDGPGAQNALLIAGGLFGLPGQPNANIARWDGVSWQPLGGGLGGEVDALTVWDPDGPGPLNPLLVAGGGFTSAGGVSANHVAAWNGSSWQPFGNGVMINGVLALVGWDADGPGPQFNVLVAGGSFTTAGGATASRIALWDGAAWQSLESGMTSNVRAVTAWDPDGPGQAPARLIAGGDFIQAGPRISPHLATYGRASVMWAAAASGQFDDPLRWSCGEQPSAFDRVIFDGTAAGYTPSAFTVTMPPGLSTVPITAGSMRTNTDTVTLDLASRPLSLNIGGGLVDASLIVGGLFDTPASLIIANSLPAPVEFTPVSAVIGDSPTAQVRAIKLIVDGAGAHVRASGDLYVGRRANRGEFLVQSGASATVEGRVSVGTDPGSVGHIHVVNSGSLFMHNNAGETMDIGVRGPGALTIGGSGVSAGADAATIGRLDSLTVGLLPGGDGTVHISGASSSWTVQAHRITFGYAAPTSVVIEDGALLDTDTLDELIIGRYPGSGAIVELRGAGSRWIERGQAISVGRAATLHVGQGAAIETSEINVLAGGTMGGAGSLGAVGGSASNLQVVNVGTIAPAADPDDVSVVAYFTIDGDLLMCDVDCLPMGACCLPSGQCIDMTGAACFAQQGIFHPNELCTSCPCAQPGLDHPDTGALQLDLVSPTGVDSLNVTGSATLAGILIVERDPAFTGAVSQSLTLLTADAGISGFFDVAFLPPVGEPGKFFRAEAPIDAARGVSTSVVLTNEDLAAAINTSANDVDNLGGAPAAAVLGDFDGTNGIDLAVALPDSADPTGAAGDLIILYNSGSTGSTWNGWSVGAVQYPVGVGPSGIDAAELDGAPGLDLVVANEGDDNVLVLANNGTIGAGQSFTAAGTFSVVDAPSAVVAHDLDLDGFADVAVSNSGSDSVSLLQNRGIVGTWQGLGQTLGSNRVDLALPAGAAPRDLCAARLNIGPELEIAVANTGVDSFSVISNDPTLRAPWGGGRFQIQPPEPTVPRPGTIQPIANPDEDKWDALGTLNLDGGSISVILNNTDGASFAFRPHVEVPIGDEPSSLVGVDLDDDGDEDLAIVATGVGGLRTVRVLRNDSRAGDTGAIYSLDNDITSTSNPLLVLAGNVNPTVDSRRDLVVLGDNTALAGARGTPQSESHVILNTSAAPPPCPGDADGNGVVNFTDILSVLANFGGPGPDGDADHNNIVNFNDVLSVLANFGATCP